VTLGGTEVLFYVRNSCLNDPDSDGFCGSLQFQAAEKPQRTQRRHRGAAETGDSSVLCALFSKMLNGQILPFGLDDFSY